MEIGTLGTRLIKNYESCPVDKFGICRPYQGKADPEGVLTIGWGHKILKGEEKLLKGITRQEAEDLLHKDIKKHSDRILIAVKVPINQGQFDSLASFQFNLGAHILETGNRGKPTTLLKELNSKNYNGAAFQFHRFCNSAGKYRDGLFYRRLTETYLFINEELLMINSSNCREICLKIGQSIGYEKDILDFYNRKHGSK
jgi:GH24 family phage-related lysozyme (muramidase)